MEELKFCYKYPRPSVTTDCVIFGYDKDGLSVLLIQRGAEPYKGCWAFPGGFLQMHEDAEEGALRELEEETDFIPSSIEQFGTFTEVNRDPRGRVITIAYYALVHKAKVRGGDDAAAAKWFSINKLPQLAFDHEHIFRVALRTLKEKIHFMPIGLEVLPATFPLSALQKLYQCILGRSLDEAKFTKVMLQAGFLTKVEDKSSDEYSDSTEYYRFNSERYEQMKANGCLLDFR